MTVYFEQAGVSLLTGATDPEGDAIAVYRINGTVVTAWPHSVDLTVGRVQVRQDGSVIYDDAADPSAHPGVDEEVPNGAFRFTLWDGESESPEYVADIALRGTELVAGDVNVTAMPGETTEVEIPINGAVGAVIITEIF